MVGVASGSADGRDGEVMVAKCSASCTGRLVLDTGVVRVRYRRWLGTGVVRYRLLVRYRRASIVVFLSFCRRGGGLVM